MTQLQLLLLLCLVMITRSVISVQVFVSFSSLLLLAYIDIVLIKHNATLNNTF